ncbi:DUF5691 domain-containing protein [Propionicicella superfundia]|uniref:DUF5691 domain-containing protein n=1 Tax=Propionicicella superfundia TaxID=348582 RepID=UPI00042A6AFC|nr:DUF5691 domain-containing protein [Propionicicella superfundia]
MTALDELSAVAAVGTGRRSTLPAVPQVAGVLPSRNPEERAFALLDAGAALAVVAKGAVEVPPGSPLAPAPPDAWPDPPAAFTAALRQLGSDGGPVADAASRSAVLVEAFGWMAARRLRLSHRLLPTFLTHPSADVRAGVVPVLGERGRWLVSVPGAPGAPDDRRIADDPWEHGTPAEQVAHLTLVRSTDPAAGLRLVTGIWSTTPAATRAQFALVIADTAGPADEDFLESCLSDRSAAVRAVAPQGLVRLPGSAYVSRMTARAADVFRSAAPGMVVTSPAPDEHDQLGAALSAQERITRLLGAVPPGAWPGLTGITASDLLRVAHADPALDLRPGLTTSALRHGDAALAAALVEAGAVHEGFAPFVPVDRLAAALDRLGAAAAAPDSGGSSLLERLPRPWPDPIARVVLARLDASLPTARRFPDSVWRLLALATPASSADAWAAQLRAATIGHGARTRSNRTVLMAAAILTVRGALWRALPPATDPHAHHVPGSPP